MNVDASLDTAELETALNCQNKHVSDLKQEDVRNEIQVVRRLKARGNVCDVVNSTSSQTALTVIRNKILAVSYLAHRARVYVPADACFNCGKKGHLANTCKAPPYCSKCNGEHKRNDCKEREVIRPCRLCTEERRLLPEDCLHPTGTMKCPVWAERMHLSEQAIIRRWQEVNEF